MEQHSYILEYISRINSGEIVVGEELKLMLSKLQKEISDENYKAERNILIDLDASEKRINFIESQCRHYEAPFAGQPFKLELFQKAFIEAIFAVKIWNSEKQKFLRKYQEILFLVGRKNGKTPLIAAICLAEWFCGPMGLKILCASNSYDQAALMHDAINNMREQSPTLERVTRKNVRGIYFGNPRQKSKRGKFSLQNKGEIKKLSARTGAKEGKNLGVGAVDEVFEMKDNSLVMPIRQALSTQEEPLYFELTTEGFTNDGYLDQRLIDARKVLNGDTCDDNSERWLIWLYTQDSEREIWDDEESWVKSNPGLDVIKSRSFLRNMVSEARVNKETRAYVLAKDFNIKQSNAQAWLGVDELDKLKGKFFDLDIIRGSVGIGGADLSESGDLTSTRMLFVNPVTRDKYFVQKYFLPASKKDENPKYEEWIKQGHLILCEGNEVDHGDVAAWFFDFCRENRCRLYRVGYDKWQAKGFVSQMEKEYSFDLEKIIQGDQLSNAMTLFENDLTEGKIYINENPIDIFCLKNVAAVWNTKGTRRQPVKVGNDYMKKIDGAVTCLICYETLDRYRSEYMEIQKQRFFKS